MPEEAAVLTRVCLSRYDNNFAIFGGWVNPLLNILVQLHSWRSPLWLFGLIVWGYAPLVLSFEGVYKPVVHQLRSISTSLKATVAGLLGRRTAVLRHNQRGDAKLPTTLTLVCCGREMTGPRARRSGAVVAILAMLTVAWFQLNSGVVPVLQDAMEESKSEGPSHTLLAVHVACMVCGVVLALAGSLAHRIYSPPKQESTGGGVEAAAVPRKWYVLFALSGCASRSSLVLCSQAQALPDDSNSTVRHRRCGHRCAQQRARRRCASPWRDVGTRRRWDNGIALRRHGRHCWMEEERGAPRALLHCTSTVVRLRLTHLC